MGWYVTCDFCKKTFKSRLECDCNGEYEARVAQSMIGCTILDSKLKANDYGRTLNLRLKNAAGHEISISVVLDCPDGEGAPQRKLDAKPKAVECQLTKEELEGPPWSNPVSMSVPDSEELEPHQAE